MTHPYDHNPYIAMLDTAQMRIAQLEAEKAALREKLRALCDAVTDYLPNGYPGPKRAVVLDKMRQAREVLQ